MIGPISQAVLEEAERLLRGSRLHWDTMVNDVARTLQDRDDKLAQLRKTIAAMQARLYEIGDDEFVS